MSASAPSFPELVFKKYDVDGSGSIDIKELRHLVSDCGHLVSDKELKVTAALLDTRGDGLIHKDEFKRWWKDTSRFSKMEMQDHHAEWYLAAIDQFHYWDKERAGYLSKAQFHDLYDHLKKNGYALPAFERAAREVDQNTDNHIDLSEFVSWLALQHSAKKP